MVNAYRFVFKMCAGNLKSVIAIFFSLNSIKTKISEQTS